MELANIILPSLLIHHDFHHNIKPFLQSALQPGCTLRGNKIEKCTQPSNIHWPIV